MIAECGSIQLCERRVRGANRLVLVGSVLCLALVGGCRLLYAQDNIKKQLDRLDWQPTQAIAGAQYLGKTTCAQCHADLAIAQGSSSMAHALAAPPESDVLRLHPRLTFNDAAYGYTIESKGNQITYTVTDGRNAISVPVSWVFGHGIGTVGQTYLLYYNGSYYESRVSFFRGIDGLSITLGHSTAAPSSLSGALGRAIKPAELRACFGCHSTGAVSDGRLQMDKLVPGISCEGCHGPASAHVAAMKTGNSNATHIFNPGSLQPGDLVKFCGACHRTQSHVEELQVTGVATVRFQPYRLTKSLCFNSRDQRISCLACHNPHQNPQHEITFYDSKCLACHSKAPERAAQHMPRSCPVARSRCVTCHMPKYILAGSHFKFTDHKIRVVRLGDNFD